MSQASSQRNFSGGEIAPALFARTDQVKYATGLRTLRNFIVKRGGGATNRPGTELTGVVGSGSVITRLIPFEFNDSQTYVLEFTDRRVRFIRDNAYLGAPYFVAVPYLAADIKDLHFTQSADVLTIVHSSYPIGELSRLADTNWTYTLPTIAPGITAPTNVTLSPATGTGTFRVWVVTALSATNEESYVSSSVGIASVSLPQERTISWNAVTGAIGYNIYASWFTTPGGYGFVGTTQALSFYDAGVAPDFAHQPPEVRDPFSGATNYPATTNFYQQRRLFGGLTSAPETTYTSRTGAYKNFTTSTPTRDDDAMTFGLASKTVDDIRHFVDTGDELLILTSQGEWVILGDAAGILRPTDINARCFSQHGSTTLAPVEIDNRVLYVHARRSMLRDIQTKQGFKGADLTIFSSHLFDGHTIVDMAYAELPNSVVWLVREDGVLLGLTDVAEQQILGWHRHDTLGTITACCVIPEGGEDRLYIAVERNGQTLVERMASRFFTDVQDAIFMDSALSYDGRNTDTSHTMTLSGGTTWAFDELLTITANFNEFSAPEVGNVIVLTGSDGTVIRLTLSSYTSATVMQGYPDETVPASMQGIASGTWSRAVNVVSGLSHLEGLEVSVFADAYVVASPNNDQIAFTCTVAGGIVTLDEPYSYIHVGLPYLSDLETLDVDTPSGPSVKPHKMMMNAVTVFVDASRNCFVGSAPPTDDDVDPLENLDEFKIRDDSDEWGPIALLTDSIDMPIAGRFNNAGRLFFRQVDPVPLTILAVMPQGFVPPPA